MVYVVYLLFANMDFAAGSAANTLFYKAIPWIVLASFVIGAAIATWFKLFDNKKFQVIGRIVLNEEK
ncbi:hypothetical protein [Kluyvera intermedia]|nr:hypothetical protein [Kluyvera intermedia]